jgi:hypothetical protein
VARSGITPRRTGPVQSRGNVHTGIGTHE